MITWTHIPEQHGGMLPEQWQARGGSPLRTIAVVRSTCTEPDCRTCRECGQWQCVVQGPDGTLSRILLFSTSLDCAKMEVEASLRALGWETKNAKETA